MHTMTKEEAEARFDELIDRLQSEPVQITHHQRVIGVMVSTKDYQAMRRFYADRLRRTLQASAQEAAVNGASTDTVEPLQIDKD